MSYQPMVSSAVRRTGTVVGLVVIDNDVPLRTCGGRTSRRRFALALAPLLAGASVLLAGSAAGAVSVAFAGEVPVTVHAARVSGSGVSASPAASGQGGLLPALATRMEQATVEETGPPCALGGRAIPPAGRRRRKTPRGRADQPRPYRTDPDHVRQLRRARRAHGSRSATRPGSGRRENRPRLPLRARLRPLPARPHCIGGRPSRVTWCAHWASAPPKPDRPYG